jgi:hypothetical protein
MEGSALERASDFVFRSFERDRVAALGLEDSYLGVTLLHRVDMQVKYLFPYSI